MVCLNYPNQIKNVYGTIIQSESILGALYKLQVI